ncbi:MAG: long-chain fatty acid--CoA ligase [Candidatus Alcyoniella australis]|nr:long-chain fatty acid--CoA ligase [Candidatus Alcyoniella australis]
MVAREDNLAQIFMARAKRHARKPCLRFKEDGLWSHSTYADVGEQVQRVALGLIALGLERGDRVALLSENRPEWAISDLAVLSAGGVQACIYSTNTPEQVGYIIRDCGARICLVSNNNQLQKVLRVKNTLPSLEQIVIFDPIQDITDRDPLVISMAQLCDIGRDKGDPAQLKHRIDSITPDDTATLIYTSGTTGMPKGVMLSHYNIISNVEAVMKVMDIGSSDVALSCLPLSHSFERTASHFSVLYAGASVAYIEGLDALAANMEEINPTVMVAVPRIFEKMHARILDDVHGLGRTAASLFVWALGIGREKAERELAGMRVPAVLRAKHELARRLVFSRIAERYGNRLRYFVSGGAPLAPEIAEFFWAIGIKLYEGYGLTETSPIVSANCPDAIKLGTVGRPLPGVEVRIADDGEIQVRGPNVMLGYFGHPQCSTEIFDPAGWLATGDIGLLDDDGFLRITDRKKDIIITASGKNIAPQNIENLLLMEKSIEQVNIVGDARKYLTAVIVPDFTEIDRWSKEQHLRFTSREETVKHPAVISLIAEAVDRVNGNLVKFETIKKFVLSSSEFSQENNMLTPTQKVRRKEVNQHFRDEIEQMYAE